MAGTVNTIATDTGRGIFVQHTTIGASGLVFRSINTGNATNGPANGIFLNNTGASGGLTVQGNGGVCTFATQTCTGGLIRSSTSNAVHLVSTQGVTLNLMEISDNDSNGVYGDELTNFDLIDSIVLDNDVTDLDTDNEAGIRFDELYGTNHLTNVVARGTKGDNVRLEMGTGTLTDLIFAGCTIGPTANEGGGFNNGFSVVTTGTPTLTIHVGTSLFTGVDATKQQSSGILTSIGGGTTTMYIINNDFQDENIAIDLGCSAGTHRFKVDNNDVLRHRTNAINIVGNGNIDGTVNNARIGGTGADSGSQNSFGIGVSHRGSGVWKLALTNNIIRNTDFEGIFVRTGDLLAGDSGSMNLTVTGNDIDMPDDNSGFPANPRGMHHPLAVVDDALREHRQQRLDRQPQHRLSAGGERRVVAAAAGLHHQCGHHVERQQQQDQHRGGNRQHDGRAVCRHLHRLPAHRSSLILMDFAAAHAAAKSSFGHGGQAAAFKTPPSS